MNISHSKPFLFIQLLSPLLPSRTPDPILGNDDTQRAGWLQPTENKE